MIAYRRIFCARIRLRGLAPRRPPKTPLERASYYQAALALAQELGAKTSELRAATQLACLYQQQGRPEAGRQLLGELYGWFTEGFASVDLQAARSNCKFKMMKPEEVGQVQDG